MRAGAGAGAGAREPPAQRPPLALRAVPAHGSRASLARSSPSSLVPPPSFSISASFLVSDSLCFILLPLASPDTLTHTRALTPADLDSELRLRKGQEKGGRTGPQAPRPAEGQQTAAGGPAPAVSQRGLTAPRQRLCSNFLLGRTRTTHRARGGPQGRPCRPVRRLGGVARRSSWLPPGSLLAQGAELAPRPWLHLGQVRWRCAPAGPRGLGPGSGASAPSCGVSSPRGTPCSRPRRVSLVLGASQSASADACPRAGGRRAHPTPPGPRGPWAKWGSPPLLQSTALWSRVPAAPRLARAPGGSRAPRRAPRGPSHCLLLRREGICAGRGLLSCPFPPAALLKAFNPPGAAFGGN